MTARSQPTRTPAHRSAPVPAPSAAAGRIDTRPVWQQLLLAIGILWLALAVVFPEIVLQRQVFVSPDYQAPGYFAAAGRAALRAGEYPLWNPFLFLGMPSFASLAFAPWVYPLSEVLGALAKLPLAAPLLWLVFYQLAAGFGVVLLLRDRQVGFWPSLLGGVAFMLMPHLVSLAVFGHGSKLANIAYLPYLALLASKIRTGERRPLWIGLFALTLGLQLLRGHPQIAFYGVLMLVVLAVVEIVSGLRRHVPRAELWRFVGGLALGGVLGVGLAAVVILPVHAYAPESIRGAGEGGGAAYQYATNWSFSPSEMATLWLPSAAGFGEGTYVGTMPFTNFPNYLGQASLLFGVAALVLLRGRWIVFLLALGILALSVSFGRNAPFVYDFFYHYVPFFNRFRVPVMILVLQQLAAATLLGCGCAALLGRLPATLHWRREPQDRDALRVLMAALVVAVFLVLITQPWSGALASRVSQSPRLPAEARAQYGEVARKLLQEDGLRVGALMVAHAAVLLLVWRRKLPLDAAGGLWVALTVADLAAVDRKMVVPQKTWPGVESRTAPAPRREPQASPLVRFLQQQPRRDGAAPVRILPLGAAYSNNQWMAFGIASVGGYHPAKLARFEQIAGSAQQTLDPRLLDLFSARYLVVPGRLQQTTLTPSYEDAEGVVYENPRAMPRAWVTGRWERTAPGEPCRARLLADDFDREHIVLLENDPQPAPDAGATGEARITAFTANRVGVAVTSSAPGLLVLSEAYHSGWRARVNGQVAPVWPADGLLRALPVPAGTSQVELQFTDPALRRGLALTVAALAGVLLLLGASLLRLRRGAAPPVETAA